MSGSVCGVILPSLLPALTELCSEALSPSPDSLGKFPLPKGAVASAFPFPYSFLQSFL